MVAREVAVRIVARLADLETRLNRLASRIERLDTQVAETRGNVGDLKQSFPWWTTVVALVLTLLPVWFGVSQIVMIRQGWRFVRGTLCMSLTPIASLSQGSIYRRQGDDGDKT